ncbi:DUF1127 domain-containing protein [Vibrio brasiliensis]|jgi:hypothetical protein|uniref:DUF1127 domain-containing protein n=1 Tax=Vibrio brasiliensis LMG 20546 TaxID=945543 RepID=E8LPN7_9VIBR|nr:hypothetical protein [Vibrio brasiliensis]EGA67333.1 hypothetical protein VIBR0546_01316 [Vibrio brasiliensis LMG 20546]MCG9650216.1 DUF1127 domain-containing protein [Vibrio brasiliensis]MCG9727323.1 DUF1127 domain-containing protein [Vibrio brasiliensis]MCG9749126.1 DUF1127 domain-containing protein [Vibrio brasiliensis]MCG9784422.1 DUF1127 domain-containing protein [Vibrio brasiliensis]
MSHSVYLKLATLLVKADLRREEQQWKRKLRRSAFDIPWNNAHLLRDIGLEQDGRPVGLTEPDSVKAERRIRHLRRVLSSRIPT